MEKDVVLSFSSPVKNNVKKNKEEEQVKSEKSWLKKWMEEMDQVCEKEKQSFSSIENLSIVNNEEERETLISKISEGLKKEEENDLVFQLLMVCTKRDSFIKWLTENFRSEEDKEWSLYYSPFLIELVLKYCFEYKLFEEFAKIFRACSSSFPIPCKLKWDYIEILRRKKDHKECVRMLNEWVKLFPQNKEAWEIKCKQELLMNSFSESLKSNLNWISCIRENQLFDRWNCLYYRIYIHTQIKQWDEATKVCEKVFSEIQKSELNEKDLWKTQLNSESTIKTSFSWIEFYHIYCVCLFENKCYGELIKKLKEIPFKVFESYPRFEHLKFYECLSYQALQKNFSVCTLWSDYLKRNPQKKDIINQFMCWNYFCTEDFTSFYSTISKVRQKSQVHPLDSLYLITESFTQSFDRFHHDSIQHVISSSMDWIPQSIYFHREGFFSQYENWDNQFWFFEDSQVKRASYWKQWILQVWALYFLFSGYPWVSWFLFSRCEALPKNCLRILFMSFIDLGVSVKVLIPVIQKEDKLKFTNTKHPLDRFLWSRYISTSDSKSLQPSDESNHDANEIVSIIQDNLERKSCMENPMYNYYRPLIDRWIQESPDFVSSKLDPFKFLFKVDLTQEKWKPWLSFDQTNSNVEFLPFQPSGRIEISSLWKRFIYIPHLRPCLNKEGHIPFVVELSLMVRSLDSSKKFFDLYNKKKEERFKGLTKNPKFSSLLLDSLRSILSKDTVPFSSFEKPKNEEDSTVKEIKDWKRFFASFSEFNKAQGWKIDQLPDMRKYYHYIFECFKNDQDKPLDLDQFWKDIQGQDNSNIILTPESLNDEIRFLQKTLETDWKKHCTQFLQTPKFFTDYPIRPFWIIIEEEWLQSETSPTTSPRWNEIFQKGLSHWLKVQKYPIYFSLKSWFEEHPIPKHKKFVLIYGAMIFEDNFTLESLLPKKQVQYDHQSILPLMIFYCNHL